MHSFLLYLVMGAGKPLRFQAAANDSIPTEADLTGAMWPSGKEAPFYLQKTPLEKRTIWKSDLETIPRARGRRAGAGWRQAVRQWRRLVAEKRGWETSEG